MPSKYVLEILTLVYFDLENGGSLLGFFSPFKKKINRLTVIHKSPIFCMSRISGKEMFLKVSTFLFYFEFYFPSSSSLLLVMNHIPCFFFDATILISCGLNQFRLTNKHTQILKQNWKYIRIYFIE